MRSIKSRRSRRLAHLERRALFLKARIATYVGTGENWDRAEYSALCWAIETLKAACLTNVITELETVALGLDNAESLEEMEHERSELAGD
jgi:hypothetical protein